MLAVQPPSSSFLNNEIKELKFQLKFFEKIFSARSIEQFLCVLYKEISCRFKIRSLVFCRNSGHYGPLQYVCAGGKVYKKSMNKNPLKIKNEFRLKCREDQQYLACRLGRPVQKTLVIPIHTKNFSSNKPSCLFVEFFSNKEQELLSFFQKFSCSMNNRLDFLFLEEHLREGACLWTEAFNQLKEPLAVFDEQGRLNSSNTIFDEMLAEQKEKNEFIAKHNIQWREHTYEQHSYSVNVCGSVYTIYHYADVTDSLLLRGKMIQNTKLSALGSLGENFAHQINNPLAGILSMAQVLLYSADMADQTKTDIEHIISAVKRSQKIISNLLDFSRVGAKLELCDLNQVVKNTLPFLKSMTCFVDFDLQFDKEPVKVKVQPCLLQQVIFNLVKNSCQAVESITSSDKKIKMYVTSAHSTALLSVEDNGQGIAEQDYENVFKLFFTTKEKNQGNGIGLSMSRRIIKSFKGRISVGRSSLGGACFTLRLPLQ